MMLYFQSGQLGHSTNTIILKVTRNEHKDVSHDIVSSEKWCHCLDKKVQDFSVVKQNSNMRISK
jgi:hypothetical protein